MKKFNTKVGQVFLEKGLIINAKYEVGIRRRI
jgi:hypothetical protein